MTIISFTGVALPRLVEVGAHYNNKLNSITFQQLQRITEVWRCVPKIAPLQVPKNLGYLQVGVEQLLNEPRHCNDEKVNELHFLVEKR
jgi:hypothetical protein